MTEDIRNQFPKPALETRQVQVGWWHICPVCDETFKSKRRDARTCSRRCRQNALRAASKRQSARAGA